MTSVVVDGELQVPVLRDRVEDERKLALFRERKIEVEAPSTQSAPLPISIKTVDQTTKKALDQRFRILKTTSILALLVTFLYVLAAPIPWLDSMNVSWRYDQLWLDGVYKQISGYTLLALSVLSAIFFIRRRGKWFSLGHYAAWRNVHSALGLLCLVTLIVHTGFRFGSGINFMLAISFIALVLLGGITAFVTVLQASNGSSFIKHLKAGIRCLHWVLFFPLSLFLSFHVIAVYYF